MLEFHTSLRHWAGDLSRPVHQQVLETADFVHMIEREGAHSRISFQHHWFAYPRLYLEPTLFLARMAAETTTLRLLTSVIKLPIHNPAELAHQVASLDHITNGRLDFGVGIGYPEHELEAVGATRAERVPRFIESLKLMKLLWTEQQVTFRGKYWSVTDVRLGPNVLQRPHPPLWYAAQSIGAARRSARLADVMLMAPQATWESCRVMVREFKEEAAKQGRSPKIGANRNLCVAPTREQALRAAIQRVSDRGQYYTRWTMNEATALDIVLTPDRDPSEYAIVGTPDECVETILKYTEELGLEYIGADVLNAPVGDPGPRMEHYQYVIDRVLKPVKKALGQKAGTGA